MITFDDWKTLPPEDEEVRNLKGGDNLRIHPAGELTPISHPGDETDPWGDDCED